MTRTVGAATRSAKASGRKYESGVEASIYCLSSKEDQASLCRAEDAGWVTDDGQELKGVVVRELHVVKVPVAVITSELNIELVSNDEEGWS